MKASRLVTKIVVRAFFILLLVALVPMWQGNKLQNIYLTFHHNWEMIFPAILIISFMFLLATCAIKRYAEQDLNWLLVLNTCILLVYCVAIFIRISHVMH